MRELIDTSDLPTPFMRNSSAESSSSTEQDANLFDNCLPMLDGIDAQEAVSRFLTEESVMKASDDNKIGGLTYLENNKDVSDIPQRVTPSQTSSSSSNAQEKKRGMESSNSSIKPPDNKKTRGLECHVRNLSIIFEALSAT